MTTTIEGLAALHIGSVEGVAPDSISVRLDLEAPQTTALNAGVPSPFPRLNGYVVIPKESGAIVGLVVWLGIERAGPIKTTREHGDVGIIDLPFPQRRMTVTPVGTLVLDRHEKDDLLRMERGVTVFPSVGDEVQIPTRAQLRAIVEPTGENRRVHVGQAVLAAGAKVSFDPDKLFGRHVAVLGNTGSGKSCTVAGLIRWSLEAAQAGRASRGGPPNARFIVLDPNGEYRKAFEGIPGGVRHFRVPPVDGNAIELSVPAWMWNGHEWSAFAAAAARVQRPMLMRALRDVRGAAGEVDPTTRGLARIGSFVRQHRDWLRIQRAAGPGAQTRSDQRAFGHRIANLGNDLRARASQLATGSSERAQLEKTAELVTEAARQQAGQNGWYDPFPDEDLGDMDASLEECLRCLPQSEGPGGESEDSPIPFNPHELVERLDVLMQDEQTGNAAGFLATLTLRIRTMLADQRMGTIVAPNPTPAFEDWLMNMVGADAAANGAVAVVDLSLVPSDVVHTVVAVLGRVVFEATQRYRRLTSVELPTTIVLEEAHSFVRRHEHDSNEIASPAQMCLQTFERIAREGRKFGLGLVLSSQRPSELSATVLAQCNTFVLHRLVNDRDQDLVARLVPDNLAGLLKELPTLPTRHAIMLGWATPLPVLMQVRELPERQRPRSADPAFWDTWTGAVERPIDWSSIAADWVGRPATATSASAAPTGDGDGGDRKG
jgi:uncharacterized protein